VFGVTERGELDRLRGVLANTVLWFGNARNLVKQVLMGPEHPRVAAARRRLLDPLDAELYRLIGERRAAPDLAEREDVLSMLLLARDEDGEGMSDAELRDELVTLLFAGHETTATGLAWAFERMGRRPEVLERLTAEAQAGATTYTDAVVKETLRLRPVVQIVVRRLLRDFELGGWLVPEGETVAVSIYLMHHREDLYPQPDAFAPERFLDAAPNSAYAWIPFGGGIRRCIGAAFAQVEMQVVLQTLVANGSFETVGPSERPKRRAVTLVPERGGQVVLAP
jgi:cytochrome P450 family 135